MKILVIDDSSSQRHFLRAYLARLGHEVVLANDGRQGIDLFISDDPDLILLDVMMPGIDGFETARVIRGSGDQWVPIIFLSGCTDSGDIETGIDAGGDDYLTKPVDPKVLEAKIRSMTRIAQMRRQLVARGDELRAANAALLRLVDMDGLTGIANRRHLDRKLTEEISRCGRNHASLSVVLLDIDHFKRFNDSHGHLAGDECLKQVARVLERELLRPSDLAARYGGEEFCLVLPETDCAGALQVAERMRAGIAALKLTVASAAEAASAASDTAASDTAASDTAASDTAASDTKASATASFGVATAVPSPRTTAQSLLTAADAALYRAKAGGRDMVCHSRLPVMPGAVSAPANYLIQ